MNLKMLNFVNNLIQDALDDECPYNICGQDDMWYEQRGQYIDTLQVGVDHYGNRSTNHSSEDLEAFRKKLESEFRYILDNLDDYINMTKQIEAEEAYEAKRRQEDV